MSDKNGHQSPSVLVVDDEPGLRDMWAFGLIDRGYRVVPTANGEEALEKVAPHHALVLDDDFDNRTITKEVLEASGYQVVLARTGGEVMEIISVETPSILLLDLSVPKLNGWEVAKQIRKMPLFVELPVIAFTAHALRGNELKAKAAGCDEKLSHKCSGRHSREGGNPVRKPSSTEGLKPGPPLSRG